MTPPPPREGVLTPPSAKRLPQIDIARGVAIVAMVVYHTAWDLSALDFIETNVVRDPAWRWFARSIAGSFLILVGIGLVLAHERGFDRAAFLRRLAKIGGAALAVTAVTFFAFPNAYIYFGILHEIAVGSVLALPFLRLPSIVALGAAVFCFIAPRIFTSPALDAPLLDGLGLGSQDPVTNDYVPIFPWFGLILIGLVLGRLVLANRHRIARIGTLGTLGRALAWAGRWSLPIYLVHQLAIFGALAGIREIVGPNPVAQCVRDCAPSRGDAAQCRAACTCVVARLRQEGALARILSGTPNASDQAALDEAARLCRRPAP